MQLIAKTFPRRLSVHLKLTLTNLRAGIFDVMSEEGTCSQQKTYTTLLLSRHMST